MVDLVKIRKKARDKKENDAAAAPQPAGNQLPAEARPPIAAPSAAEAQPARKSEKKQARSSENSQERTAQTPPAVHAPAGPSHETPPAAAVETRPQGGVMQGEKLRRFLETAGQRRREEIAADNAAELTNQLEVLTFALADEQYAIDIENVVEIVTPRPVTPIPNADPSIVGILSLRGTIVTLIDVRRRLRHPTQQITPETRIIVTQGGEDSIGFAVDRVLRVLRIERSAVDPHPVVHTSEQDDSVRGVFRHGDALTILLDLDKLLARTTLSSAP